ncbi:MAG: UDP-N-acetylmuramoyl-L-alanine--D-glutamate ligase [Bacillaceae bacterium]|nr:UDP-N-acetylmuramoyl-L-alanine--D-glutamate ligase [Bacillaceae bacterium]
MRNIDKFKGKKVLVIGLAKSGLAVSKLLHRLHAHVIVNDYKAVEDNAEAKELQTLGIDVVCGGHPLNLLDESIDFVVKNPGIPYTNPIVAKAIDMKLPVITEIEIASMVSEAQIIAITGSNGKTTTTTLVCEMLKNSPRDPLVAGNIGTVASEVVQHVTEKNILVTEVSSFQLMGTKEFKPKIAVFLNLFDAHLDYHGTKEEYGNAKANIFANLTGDDFYIFNQDNEDVVELSKQAKGQTYTFSVKNQVERGTFIKENSIYFNDEKIISLDKVVLPGKHNLENVLAAICAAKLADARNEQIVKVLTSFTGVKHRTQFVATVANRKFYNDSKATNILATQVAISAFSEPLILLAGGLDRGNNFDELVPSLQTVKGIVVFGQTAPKLIEAAKKAGIQVIEQVHNVEEAVHVAFKHSLEGDVILLSPACASWDQFKTFEERGDTFIKAVSNLSLF